MKKIALALTALTALAVAPALAQQKAPAAATPSSVQIPTKVFYKGQGPQQYLAKDKILGAKIYNKDGQIIGDVEDLIMNSSNEIEGVIMGVGGFLGAGEKKIGVRYSALKVEKKDGKTTISLPEATKDVLAAVQPYERAEARKSFLERAKEKAKELTDKTKESSGPALEKAKEVGGSAVDKTKELGKAAAEKGKSLIDAAKEKAAPKPQ
jgi:sporulation protein YlmC with PRC-barrel domain